MPPGAPTAFPSVPRMLCLKVNQLGKLPNHRQVSQLESQLIYKLGNHVNNMHCERQSLPKSILPEHYNERNLM